MSDLSEFVTLNDSTLTTDSRRVAKHFHKRHDNVLRSFDNLDCSREFNRLHFEAVTGTYTSGKVGNQESRLIHWRPGPKGSALGDALGVGLDDLAL